MIAPSLPEGLEEALKNVRANFRLVWNPAAKVKRAGHFDAMGSLVEKPVYDPRWEVWDTDPQGADYKVMTVQSNHGEFRQAGFWLVELLEYINPERFGGKMERLMAELVDKPNDILGEISDKDAEDLFEQAAKWHIWADTPKVGTLTNL